MYSLPRCLWYGVDPSWAFPSASGGSAESSSSPATCESDVVGEVVVAGSQDVSQQFELVRCDVVGQWGDPCAVEYLSVCDRRGCGVDHFCVVSRGDVRVLRPAW